jgi:hypothetical protein
VYSLVEVCIPCIGRCVCLSHEQQHFSVLCMSTWMHTQVRNISAKDVAGLVKEGWVVLDVRPPTETNRAPVANSVHVSTWTIFTLQLAPARARPSILYPICIACPMFPLRSVTLGAREMLE